MDNQKASKQKRCATAIELPHFVETPSKNDIVLGQGSAQSWRPGNVRFHDMLDQISPRYQSCKIKTGKRQIIQEIYDTICATGRFLQKDEHSDNYVEVDEDEALTKIGYAIRYRKKRIIKAETELTRQIEQEMAQQHFATGSSPTLVESQVEPSPTAYASSPTLFSNQGTTNLITGASIALFSDEDLESVLDDPTDQKQAPTKDR